MEVRDFSLSLYSYVKQDGMIISFGYFAKVGYLKQGD